MNEVRTRNVEVGVFYMDVPISTKVEGVWNSQVSTHNQGSRSSRVIMNYDPETLKLEENSPSKEEPTPPKEEPSLSVAQDILLPPKVDDPKVDGMCCNVC